jgi:hypothetical protein
MRVMKAFIFVIAGMLIFAGPASARINKPEQISTKGARNICSGHNPHSTGGGDWGCGFCGPHNCTNVSCPKGGKCSVTIVDAKGKPKPIRTGANGTKGTNSNGHPVRRPINVVSGVKPILSSGSTPEGKAGGIQHGGGYRR